MSRVMLDASALLAYLKREPGGQFVPAVTGEAVMSAVNYAEVVSVLISAGLSEEDVEERLSEALLDIIGFDADCAQAAGLMIAKTKTAGLSLGDRACLATARRENIPVMTADRAWRYIDPGVEVQFIR